MSGTSYDGTLDLGRPGDRENYFVVREGRFGTSYLLDYTMEVANGYVIKTDLDEDNQRPWTTQVSRLNLTGDPANPIGTAYLVTTSYEDGRTGITQIAPGPGQPSTGESTRFYDAQGRVLTDVVSDLDGTTTTTDYAPSSGRIDYQSTTETVPFGTYVPTATDYDLTNASPWSSYTIHRAVTLYSSYITDTVAVMDDGSTVTVTNLFGDLTSSPVYVVPTGQRTVVTDAQGRLDYITESNGAPRPEPGQSLDDLFVLRTQDYSTETGKLDYVTTNFTNGIRESIDYNAATGLADYGVTAYTDGRVVVRDYDAAGRLDYAVTTYADGSTLSEDLDTATGGLDYAVNSNLGGRVVATDYDLTGAFDWSSVTVSYKRTGDPRRPTEAIPNITIQYDDGHRVVTEQDYSPAPLSLPGEARTFIYDIQGRLDYATVRDSFGNRSDVDYEAATGRIDYLVQHLNDGRTIATDYDLADTQPWTTYSITYDALGNITGASTT